MAAPPSPGVSTAPGPPVRTPPSSTNPATPTASLHPSTANGLRGPSNPYKVDFVIPYDIHINPKQDKVKAQEEVREGYLALLQALESAGGLKIATKVPKGNRGKDEIWVFVSATDDKINELVDVESILDAAHNLPPHPRPRTPSPATRLRLLYELLVNPKIQHGLGITPGENKWKRVKSIVALHDDESDRAWVERWTVGGDWRIGLLKGLDGKQGDELAQHQPPPVHLYFDYLTTYTLSLLPLSVISIIFWLYVPADSYPPLYALILSLYATIFVTTWRIKERKLAVRWGTRGSESVAVGRLRPEYVANLGLDEKTIQGDAVDAIHAGNSFKRDIKVASSAPLIIACGVFLGFVLMGLFLLEAFVAAAYEGPGKQFVPLVPTALFSLIVPQIVAAYQILARRLVKWEDHPTPVGEHKSLTGKTFAMNAIVAYLGLFLSAYVYIPFGPTIMAVVQHRLKTHEGKSVKFADSPEKAGLGPKTAGSAQAAIKADRLKTQLFAYTVTNQAINAFLELGLPYILRWVQEWRQGKASLKDAIGGEKTPPKNEEDRFLDKVAHEIDLPDYDIFVDYAEMVTQFGYVVVWSIVWPLAPVFALINNYIELRSDALKICKHVRRPVGDRVETIGSWLQTLAIISWVGAITNATLVYLFRPSIQAVTESKANAVGSAYLHHVLSQFHVSAGWRQVLPTLLPLVAIALAASHGYILLQWAVEVVAEHVLWRGSPEELQVQHLAEKSGADVNSQVQAVTKRFSGAVASAQTTGGFWNGGEEGASAIASVGKAE